MLRRMVLSSLVVFVLIVIMAGTGSADPGLMNNALLWKRLGLNRAVMGGDAPKISSTKKRGESTVYYIKLPPQPNYYIPLNYIPSSGDPLTKDTTPDPFETVSVDFTANGKPESVYHWNLPLGYTMPSSSSTTSTTTTTTTTTPAPVQYYKKAHHRQNFFNNGKPQKLYFVKPSLRYYPTKTATSSTTTESSPTSTTTMSSSSTSPPSGKILKKHYFRGNGKPNQLYFVKRAHYHNSHLF